MGPGRATAQELTLALCAILLISRHVHGGRGASAPHCDQDCREGLKIASQLRSVEESYPGSGVSNPLHQLASSGEREVISQFSDLFEHVPPEPCLDFSGPQKTGTTDLYDRLCRHSSIVGGRTKEPQYWTERMPLKRKSALSEIREKNYTANFWPLASKIASGMKFLGKGNSNSLPTEANQVTVDGSATTLYLKRGFIMENNMTLAPFFHAMHPDVKLIMILRDPIERMYSDYRYFFGTGNPLRGFEKAMKKPRCSGPPGTLRGESSEIEALTGPGPSPEHFHEVVKRKIARLNSCISEKGLKNCSRYPEFAEAGIFVCPSGRLMMGIYSVYIEEWLEVFPREQLYVFRMEDLDVRSSSSSEMTHDDIEGSKAAKRRELSKVFDFLGVEEPNTESWELIADHKVSNKIQSIGSMLPETKILLREFYAPFNEKLSTLLGDKKFLWDDVH